MVWELRTLGQFGTLGNFKLSTNRLAILSAGQTFKHHTPSLIARASRLPQSVGGYKGISIVARQNSTPTRPKDISPRSRPTESGSARAYPVSAPLRRFSDFILSFRRRIIPFPVGGKSAGRQGKGKRNGRIGRLASSRPLTGSYSTGQDPEILISVIFLCRSVHSSYV